MNLIPVHETVKMGERTMRTAAVFCSLTGILSLMAAPVFMMPAGVKVCEISGEMAGRAVKACGEVCEAAYARGTFFGSLCGGSYSVEIVSWNVPAPAEGERVCVTGKVGLYDGDVEIIVKGVEHVR
jgi:hypothetical protein